MSAYIKNNVLFLLSNFLILSAWLTVFLWLNSSPHWITIFSQLNVSLSAIFGVGVLFLGLSQLQPVWQPPVETKSPPNQLKFITHVVAAILPLLLFWLLYHNVLNSWFSYDDPCYLNHVNNIGLFSGFFDPDKQVSNINYTPFFPLSLGLDYQLFGLNPLGFYWHHLLSFSLVLLFAYAVFARFFAPLFASMIVSLFIVTVPVAQVINFLMVRHYIEGLGFSFLAVWFYMQAVRPEKTQWFWAVLGSAFYFLATTAKEIYVPLVVALVWLPVGTVNKRLRMLIPYVVVAILYTMLRTYILGVDHVLSGYPERTTTLLEVFYFPMTYVKIMGWQTIWQWLPLLGVVILLGFAIWQKPFSLGLSCLVWLGVAVLPVIPIIWRMNFYYYLFLFGLLFAIGCGIAFKQLTTFLVNTPWRNAVISFLFLTLLLANLLPVQTGQTRLQAMKKIQQIQDEFLLQAQLPETVLIYDYYCAQSFISLRENVFGHTETVKWCPKEDCLCTAHYPSYTTKQYVDGQWQTKTLPTHEECGKTKDLSRDLSVALTLTPPKTLTWHFGPYSQEQGQYYVSTSLDIYGQQLSSSIVFNFGLPPQGTYTFCCQPLLKPFTWKIKYESAEGWETYSPLLVLEPKQVNAQGLAELVWQRPFKPETTQ